MSKVLSLGELALKTAAERRKGRKVVHCHGVFDLLHVGHIRHFERAKSLGHTLVVTVTPDRFVNKGPHRPAFHEGLRAEAVAALACVDHVAVNAWPDAVQTIKLLRPSIYMKGSDYRSMKDDVTGGIRREKRAVESGGGKLVFTDEVVFSSSSLINRHLPAFTPELAKFFEGFTRRHGVASVLGWLEDAKRLSLLAVGEAIVDEYAFCEAIGKSSKEPTLVVKGSEAELFAGGILAVANNAASICRKVSMLAMIGRTKPRLDFIRRKLLPSVRPLWAWRSDGPTILKRRYVESYHFTKLLEVYEIQDAATLPKDEAAWVRLIAREAPRHQATLVVDYGHGMLGEKAIKALRAKAEYLIVNAQSNAGNIGYHTIDRYGKVDLACMAENELRMERRDRRGDLRGLLESLCRERGWPRAICTRGKTGSLAYERGRGFSAVPAFAGVIKDRVGAGDAFLSVAGPLVAAGAPLEVAQFLGNAAGAQAVATVGHRQSLDRATLIKHTESLLK
ncbi:MAG: adenylyltransferase/cytidyltransferase family protein [Elusimicrobia bacterium]|nr:adenylyltransferase/cytidyltransferase family protein [Elusimicrobiota bacterium]